MRTLNFGTTYIIFPLNSAKFSWTTARDLVLDNHSDADWSSYTSGNLKYDDEFKSKMENINEYITKRRQGFWVASPESQEKNRYEYSINSDVIYYVYVISKNLNKVYFKRIIEVLKQVPEDTINTKSFRVLKELRDLVTTNIGKFKRQINLDSFKQKYQPKNTDFAGALRSGNEICISGHYLALKEMYWIKFCEDHILGAKKNEN